MKEHFSKLPQNKKQKLLRYSFDPEVVKNIYGQKVEPNSKKTLYGGDVTIEDETTVTEEFVEDNVTTSTGGWPLLSSLFLKNIFAAPTTKEYTASHTKTVNIIVGGWVKYHAWVKYRVVNGKVKKILTGGATVAKFLCLNPITMKQCSKYIMGNKAHCEAVWEISTPVLKTPIFDISPIALVQHHEVHGYPNGQVTHSYWPHNFV